MLQEMFLELQKNFSSLKLITRGCYFNTTLRSTKSINKIFFAQHLDLVNILNSFFQL